MARAIDQQSKKSYYKVLFSYGVSSQKGYTNWTRAISGTPNYDSFPAMDIRLPENTGTLEEGAHLIIQMARDSFSERLGGGVPHSPCKVEVWDITDAIDPLTDVGTELKVWSGMVTRTVKHPNGQRNRVEIRSQLQKNRLDVPLGVPATHQCNRTLGVGLCHATLVEVPGLEVVSILPRSLEVDAMSTAGLEDRHFQRGYLLLDGLRLAIRDWRIATPKIFYLARQAPAEWLGEDITAVSGCDKSIETCRRRYSSEEDFFGLGYSIPPYSPILEPQ